MITVGITGGIGSGKTSVCNQWSQLGAFIINADELAKQLMTNDSEAKQQIIDTFGEDSFTKKGLLNRQYLAKEAFKKGRVNELNAIVHPKMPALLPPKIEQAKRAGYTIVVYEAALLLENLGNYDFDYLVLVLADEENRVEWVQKRDGSQPADIKQRMNKQWDFENAADEVNYVIKNDGSLAELKKKAHIIFQNFQ